MSGRRLAGLVAPVAAWLACGAPLVAQGADAALLADTVRVGDIAPVAVRVEVGPGERIVWPDTLPLAGVPAENAARVRERVDTAEDGTVYRTGVYAVTPWRTGALALPALEVGVAEGEGPPRARRVELPELDVVSVLPADTSGLEPRPARGVIGANWAWGRLLLLALLAVAVTGGLLWWWRRRRSEAREVSESRPSVPPRERALAALAAARESGLVERGEMKEFYTRFSNAVRDYMAALEPGWGEDLTTTELLARIRARVGAREAAALRGVLAPADRVKFARRVPDREAALAEWQGAVDWVEGFAWPPPAPEEAAA